MVIALNKYDENYISDDGFPSRLTVIKDMLAPKKETSKERHITLSVIGRLRVRSPIKTVL